MTVYFVRFEHKGRWKIGYTEHTAETRTSGLTFTPCEYEIVAQIPGEVELEQAIHRRFAAQRVPLPGRKEIFESSPELERFVAYAKAFNSVDGFDEAQGGDFSVVAKIVIDAGQPVPRAPEDLLLLQAKASPSVHEFRERGTPQFRKALKDRVMRAWKHAENALGLQPISEIPVGVIGPVRDHEAVTETWWPRSEVTDFETCFYWRTKPLSGVTDGLRYLLTVRGEEKLALAWCALVALEVTRARERRDRQHVEYIEYLPVLAEHEVAPLPKFHHKSEQFLPGFSAVLIAEDSGWPVQLETFVLLCRAHMATSLSEHAVLVAYAHGSYCGIKADRSPRFELPRVA